MKRLIHATGTWQIIMAVSALRQDTALSERVYEDYLVLSAPRLSELMKQTMLKIASAIWKWRSIVWAEDLLDINIPALSKHNIAHFLQVFRQRVAVEKLDELWVCKLSAKAEKILVESYRSASIVLYEDGLQSYVPHGKWNLLDPQLLSDVEQFKKTLKHRIKEKIGRDYLCINYYRCICHNHIDRIDKVYFFLGKYLPLPNYLKLRYRQLENKVILDTFQAIFDCPEIGFDRLLDEEYSSPNQFLILGQCFSDWKLLSWEEELEMYGKIFSTLAKHNFTPIWKEHPRANKPFFPELARQYSATAPLELNIHFSWPIELFVKKLNLVGCASISSTSLFYLKDLFNIPTYTFAIDRLKSFNNPDFYYMAKFVGDLIPPLETIDERDLEKQSLQA